MVDYAKTFSSIEGIGLSQVIIDHVRNAKKMYKKYDKLDFSSTDYTTLNQIIYHVRKMQICKNHANFDMRNKRNIPLIILMMNFCKSTSIL